LAFFNVYEIDNNVKLAYLKFVNSFFIACNIKHVIDKYLLYAPHLYPYLVWGDEDKNDYFFN